MNFILNSKQKISAENVIMLKAEINYTWLYMIDNKKILVCNTLKNLEKSFSEKENFYRISRSTIVNLDFLKLADFYTSEIFLNDESCFQIARRRRTNFLNFIKTSNTLQPFSQNRKREFIFS